ncbi:hypothetical protein AALO_G00260180 [Alosa alosa]|uniref:Uncharacterized protein n=1 Tax=Alosa alosa TaxID=278164 RepID=A0AAV6FQH8_9TELE|nr:hypothetical protein AALO_G00260180 [Alosa alosa]
MSLLNRAEVATLTSWCQDNNLLLNVSKTKELIVDCRERSTRPFTQGDSSEKVSCFRFLGININEESGSELSSYFIRTFVWEKERHTTCRTDRSVCPAVCATKKKTDFCLDRVTYNEKKVLLRLFLKLQEQGSVNSYITVEDVTEWFFRHERKMFKEWFPLN